MNIKELAASCEAAAASKVMAVKATYPDCESAINENWLYEGGDYFDVTSTNPNVNIIPATPGASMKTPAAGGTAIYPGAYVVGGATVRGTLVVGIEIYPAQAVNTVITISGRAGVFSRNVTEYAVNVNGQVQIAAGETWGVSSLSTNGQLPT